MSIACRKGSAVARDFFPFVEDGEVGDAGEGRPTGSSCSTLRALPSMTTPPRRRASSSWGPRTSAPISRRSPRRSTASRTSRGAPSPSWSFARSWRTSSTPTSRRPPSPSSTGETRFAFRTRGRASRRSRSRSSSEPPRRPRTCDVTFAGWGRAYRTLSSTWGTRGAASKIEDNISGGTVVTISTRPAHDARGLSNAGGEKDEPVGAQQGWPVAAAPAPPYPGAATAQPAWPQPWQQGAPWPQQPAGYPGYQTAYQQQGWQQPGWQQAPQPAPPQPAWAAAADVSLDDRGAQALSLVLERGAAGPTDLVQAYGSSAATWSRALASLASQGAVDEGRPEVPAHRVRPHAWRPDKRDLTKVTGSTVRFFLDS